MLPRLAIGVGPDASRPCERPTRPIALTAAAPIRTNSRMKRPRLLLVIAVVAASISAAGPPAAAVAAPKNRAAHDVAVQIEQLIRNHVENVEIVATGGPGSSTVRVVRGKAAPAGLHGSDEAVTVAGGSAVHVLRGSPAAVAMPLGMAAAPGRSGHGTVQVVAFAARLGGSVTVLRGAPPAPVVRILPEVAGGPDLGLFGAAPAGDLDRVAFAVDGAESSHGADPGMWRAQWAGPQGPMQVSAAAAADTGGGDRFDPAQNRLLGRAYLARLYRRYGNWPDAIAAYNWGPGNFDAWIAQGRPAASLPFEVERYRDRVLRDGGLASPPAVLLSTP